MDKHKVGVISDTHGLLRECVLKAFDECDLIIHAGDIGKKEVIDKLKLKAPVVVVRGNCDKGSWIKNINKTEVVEIGGVLLYILHDINDLDLEPKSAGIKVVISGHSHRPSLSSREGILYLNPGSAGPRRFKLPISAALLSIDNESVEAKFINFILE